MLTDSDLIARLHDFLRQSDLNTTTTAIVRRRLEEDFGIDLSDRKKFIREQVDLYLQSQFENVAEQHGEEEQGDGEVDDDQTEKVKSEETGGSHVDEDDDEEASTTNKKKQNSEGKRRGGGFAKLCSLSPQLQKIVGAPTLARTGVVKQIWAYIREKNLQDPANKRTIICDETLHALFGVKSIDMFQMNKALTKHIWPLDSDGVVPAESMDREKQCRKERQEVVLAKSMDKEKQCKREREEDPDEPKRKEKRQKGGGKSGFLAPLQLSDALVKFLGTGESEMPRGDVIKRMWDYIKGNNLQAIEVYIKLLSESTRDLARDPSDKRRIICDEKLKELFNVDSFTGFTVSKLLAAHFVKA